MIKVCYTEFGPVQYSSVYFLKCRLTEKLFCSKSPHTKYHPVIAKEVRSISGYSNYRKNFLRNRLKSLKPYREAVCIECDSIYLTNLDRSKCCSKKCTDRRNNRIRRKKEKARLKTAIVERVDPIVVFNEYNWKCNLCGIDTPKMLRGRHCDNSPELDHIIPLSKGGEHTYRNVQLLCRSCNQAKSDKIE